METKMRTRNFLIFSLVATGLLASCGKLQSRLSENKKDVNESESNQDAPPPPVSDAKPADFANEAFIMKHRPKEVCYTFDVTALNVDTKGANYHETVPMCIDAAALFNYDKPLVKMEHGTPWGMAYAFVKSENTTIPLAVGTYRFSATLSEESVKLRSIYWFGEAKNMVETYYFPNRYNGINLETNWSRHIPEIAKQALSKTPIRNIVTATLNLSSIRAAWDAKWSSANDPGSFQGVLVGLPETITGTASVSDKADAKDFDILIKTKFAEMKFY